jgi:hypothetical protein
LSPHYAAAQFNGSLESVVVEMALVVLPDPKSFGFTEQRKVDPITSQGSIE